MNILHMMLISVSKDFPGRQLDTFIYVAKNDRINMYTEHNSVCI